MLIEPSDVRADRIIHFLDVSKRNSLWNSIKQASTERIELEFGRVGFL